MDKRKPVDFFKKPTGFIMSQNPEFLAYCFSILAT